MRNQLIKARSLKALAGLFVLAVLVRPIAADRKGESLKKEASRQDAQIPMTETESSVPIVDSPDVQPDAYTDTETSGSQVQHTEPLAISLAVSGGSSLGAYQAGYLFYLTEAAKLNPDLIDLNLVTGASAGMINALLTTVSMGRGSDKEPKNSLFYRVWTEVRYNELLDVDKAPPKALSSRTVLVRLADEIEKHWVQGLSENLDMVLGATTTRLKSYPMKISEGLTVPRQEEKFVFRVRGRGPGKKPLVTNYVDQAHGSEQPLLPFSDPDQTDNKGGQTNFSSIRQILFASSAIPLVFLPQEIDFCMTNPEEGAEASIYALRTCPEAKHKELFIDGAISDRRPLRLAYRITQSGLTRGENAKITWRDEPDLKNGKAPDNVFFLYIDPGMVSYPMQSPQETDEALIDNAARLFPAVGALFRGLLVTAQSKELSTLIEEHPEVRQRIQLVSHDFPTMSGQLLNFFGFFEREFRKFDFYLGMRDARNFVENKLTPRIRHVFNEKELAVSFPEPDKTATSDSSWAGSWRPYFCLRAAIDGEDRFKEACHSKDLEDFRILLQTTLDRLYDHCRKLPYDETIDHLHCMSAMSGNSPPKVWHVSSDYENTWKKRDDADENMFEYIMRLLETYHFRFRDLGLDRDDASLAMSRIRMEMLVLADAFAKKLPRGERIAMRVLGKPAVNFFSYAPPETILYLVAGTGAEFALSATLGQSNWLRYNFALQMQGFYILLTEKPNVLTLTPLLGVEAEINPLSSPLLQTRFGLRIGYQFSTNDGFLSETCNTAIFRNDSFRCSAPVTQIFIALSFYERIRLQGGIEWLPRWLPPMDKFDENVWNGFVEVGWQWISPF
ncbi:MAG: patatin-like phospholipase family protein [Proteobacteria bacterium]|nr:patatin-like phospholipase family protein [Pseudomonadota bacterium]